MVAKKKKEYLFFQCQMFQFQDNFICHVIFADNTNIFCSDACLRKLMENVTVELGKLKLWFDAKKLSLNLKKKQKQIYVLEIAKPT